MLQVDVGQVIEGGYFIRGTRTEAHDYEEYYLTPSGALCVSINKTGPKAILIDGDKKVDLELHPDFMNYWTASKVAEDQLRKRMDEINISAQNQCLGICKQIFDERERRTMEYLKTLK